MTGSTIYLVGVDGELVPMTQRSYDNEELLQRLVAAHPSLLGGGRVGSRWLLVQREMPIPDQQAGTGRWSLDHLFVDDQAIPTLVEVKRATDTRIRREVVGQLLDYAANGVEYWPPGELRRALEARLGGPDDADAAVSELAPNLDPDEFWQRTEANLRAGRVRLVILADVIPKELQRIVEFLNERMPDTEALALEVRQYLGEGRQTLVPQIVGNTTAAQRVKATRSRPEFATVLAKSSPQAREVHDRLAAWVRDLGGVAVPASSSISFQVDGRQVVRLYPAEDAVELILSRLRRRGLDAEADGMHAELSAMCPSRRLTTKSLYLPVGDLIERWGSFVGVVLPRFMDFLEMPHADSEASVP